MLGGTVGVFAVIVFSLLALSKETYSVLYEPREFRNSVYRYLLSIDAVLAYMFIFAGGVLSSVIFNVKIKSSGLPDWFGHVLLSMLALICLLAGVYILYLSVNYWKHDRHIVLRFEPQTRTIIVSTDSQEYVLNEGAISKVRAVTRGEGKIQFAHYRFVLDSGAEFVLTNKTKGVLGIFEYFKGIQVQYQKHWLPIIR